MWIFSFSIVVICNQYLKKKCVLAQKVRSRQRGFGPSMVQASQGFLDFHVYIVVVYSTKRLFVLNVPNDKETVSV